MLEFVQGRIITFSAIVSRETNNMILYKDFAALPNFMRRHLHYALRTSHYALKPISFFSTNQKALPETIRQGT